MGVEIEEEESPEADQAKSSLLSRGGFRLLLVGTTTTRSERETIHETINES